jgi:hypothetical protein
MEGEQSNRPVFTGPYADARERLFDLAVESKMKAAKVEAEGFVNAAKDHRAVAKMLTIASKYLAGEELDLRPEDWR